MSNKLIKYKDWKCIARIGRYDNGRIAIRLVDSYDGHPVATATINVPNVEIQHDEVIIKDYAENEGVLRALEEAGLVFDTGKRISVGYTAGKVCKFNPKARTA